MSCWKKHRACHSGNRRCFSTHDCKFPPGTNSITIAKCCMVLYIYQLVRYHSLFNVSKNANTYVRSHKYLFESHNVWVYELPVVQNLSLDIFWVKSVTQWDHLYGYIFSYINIRVLIVMVEHQIIARGAAHLFRHFWRDIQTQRFLQGIILIVTMALLGKARIYLSISIMQLKKVRMDAHLLLGVLQNGTSGDPREGRETSSPSSTSTSIETVF